MSEQVVLMGDCFSGLRAPQSLLDADWVYGVAPCGFVVRAPREPYLRDQSSELHDQLDEHSRCVHPARWERDQLHARMSAD